MSTLLGQTQSLLPRPAGAAATDVVEITPAIRSWRVLLRSLWRRRELVGYLAWRDIRARYHQTILGLLWALVQPLATTLVFAVVFGKLAGIRSSNTPYPVFVMAGLLPWQFFATCTQRASVSLLANGAILKKVYFPRLAIPISAVTTGLVEFVSACVVFVGVMYYFGVGLSVRIVLLPAVVLLTCLMSLGLGLMLAAVNCRFRDASHGIPFVMQMWMFLTPVVYPTSLLPEPARLWMSLNPMTGLIDGYRAALLGWPLDFGSLGLSAAMAALSLVIGGAAFRRAERGAADVL